MESKLIGLSIILAAIIISLGGRYEILKLNDSSVARVDKLTGNVCFISPGNTYSTMTCKIYDVTSDK